MSGGPGIFFKNNAGSSQNKQGSLNIRKHEQAGDPRVLWWYEHAREISIISDQKNQPGYGNATKNRAYAGQINHEDEIGSFSNRKKECRFDCFIFS